MFVAREDEHWVYAVAAISSLEKVDMWYTSERKKIGSAEFIDSLETVILKRAKQMFGDTHRSLWLWYVLRRFSPLKHT